MPYRQRVRPSRTVAVAVLTAALAAGALPSGDIPALDPAGAAAGPLAATAGFGDAPTGTGLPAADRMPVSLPNVAAAWDWKPPRFTLTGYATFYDNGTTAMRLPRGTVVVICGAAGCLERVVTDYGPIKAERVVDLYRPDFFRICGCGWWSGTTWVTVWVY
jgi:hypothetical protein